MPKNIIISLMLILNLGLSFGQSIGSQLIGSAGETVQSESGITLNYSVGETVVDYYKCVYNFRIGFIQSIPLLEQSDKQNEFHKPSSKITSMPNRPADYFKGDEKYILFDAVGRVLKTGFNFRKDDPTIQFPMTGIYFVQSAVDDKTVRIQKIFVSR